MTGGFFILNLIYYISSMERDGEGKQQGRLSNWKRGMSDRMADRTVNWLDGIAHDLQYPENALPNARREIITNIWQAREGKSGVLANIRRRVRLSRVRHYEDRNNE